MLQADGVLFDLDGTLLDTAPDLGAALNAVLLAHGHMALPSEYWRPYVSQGAMALIRIGFKIEANHSEAPELLQALLDYYQQHLSVHTSLFAGMETVLDNIEELDIPWGIVTNKPAYLTDPLLTEMGLYARAGCVVSGDTLAQKKPHPAPMFLASKLIDVPPDRCVMIGDDRRDIDAGKAAGMRTIAAAYGYIPPRDPANLWQADTIVHTAADIWTWLTATSLEKRV